MATRPALTKEQATPTLEVVRRDARYLVGSDGAPQAVVLDIDRWEELLSLLERAERLEEEWLRPFAAVRAAWAAGEPAPLDDEPLDDDTLVALVHEARDQSD